MLLGELLKFYIVIRSTDPMRPHKQDDNSNPQYQILVSFQIVKFTYLNINDKINVIFITVNEHTKKSEPARFL